MAEDDEAEARGASVGFRMRTTRGRVGGDWFGLQWKRVSRKWEGVLYGHRNSRKTDFGSAKCCLLRLGFGLETVGSAMVVTSTTLCSTRHDRKASEGSTAKQRGIQCRYSRGKFFYRPPETMVRPTSAMLNGGCSRQVSWRRCGWF